MYMGRIVEEAETDTLFGDPRHPYTQVLLSALPGARPRGGRRTAGQREAKEPLQEGHSHTSSFDTTSSLHSVQVYAGILCSYYS